MENLDFFKKTIWRTQVLYVGPLVPPFWTYGDVCTGFQITSGSNHLRALLPAHDGLHGFICSITPAGLVVVSMAADPFTHIFIQVLV